MRKSIYMSHGYYRVPSGGYDNTIVQKDLDALFKFFERAVEISVCGMLGCS